MYLFVFFHTHHPQENNQVDGWLPQSQICPGPPELNPPVLEAQLKFVE